jgi:hypothetical protein
VAFWVWDALARGWRLIMRPLATAMPYADIAVFLYALLAAGLAFAHSSEMPSARAWSHDHVLLYAQFGVFILLGLTQLAVLVFERRSRRHKELEDACQLVAAYIDEHCPAVRLRDVGIHLWTTAVGSPVTSTRSGSRRAARPRSKDSRRTRR